MAKLPGSTVDYSFQIKIVLCFSTEVDGSSFSEKMDSQGSSKGVSKILKIPFGLLHRKMCKLQQGGNLSCGVILPFTKCFFFLSESLFFYFCRIQTMTMII